MEESGKILDRERHQEILSKYLDAIPEEDKLFIFWQLSVWYRGKLISVNDVSTDMIREYLKAQQTIDGLENIIEDLMAKVFPRGEKV